MIITLKYIFYILANYYTAADLSNVAFAVPRFLHDG